MSCVCFLDTDGLNKNSIKPDQGTTPKGVPRIQNRLSKPDLNVLGYRRGGITWAARKHPVREIRVSTVYGLIQISEDQIIP